MNLAVIFKFRIIITILYLMYICMYSSMCIITPCFILIYRYISIHVCRAGHYNIIVNRDIKHHNNRYRREIFSIIISVAKYYRQYCEYRKVLCSITSRFCNITEILHTIFTISTLVVLILLAQLISQ